MKYIKNRVRFLSEKNIGWLDTKKEEWSQEFGHLIESFHSTIEELIETLKENYNDKDDPTEVKKEYIDAFDAAFENLILAIREVENEDDLRKLWGELTLDFALWKNTFKTISEEMDTYNSIFMLGYSFFEKINTYITTKICQDYDDALTGELDDMRTAVVEFIEDFVEDINARFLDINEDDVYSKSNLDEQDTDDMDLTAGNEVRYTQDDGAENNALISNNQEELENKDDVRLVSKVDGEQFVIDKSQIIEILPKNKTVNQEVVDKLKVLRNDVNKLGELNDILTDLVAKEE